MYADLSAVRSAVKDCGVKLELVAKWAGVRPDTVTRALKFGTKDVRMVQAIRRALSVASGDVPVEALEPLWRK